MSVIFVSLFDKNYLIKGIAMVDSLIDNSFNQKILILSLDKVTFDTLHKYYYNSTAVSIKNLDFIETEILLKISKDRSYREWCWALSSILSFTALSKQKLDVVYLDADLFFFNSVESLVRKCASSNAAITPHRFSETHKHLEINGKFNVQWVYFKNNKIGQKIAYDWMSDCIISTKYDPKAGIVGDQKYLDLWPSRYPNTLEINDPGVGLAPWNQTGVCLYSMRDSIHISFEEKLIFYHFHSMNIYFNKFILPVNKNYKLEKSVYDLVYLPYVAKINQVNSALGIKTKLISSKGPILLFLNFLQFALFKFTESSIWQKIRLAVIRN